MVRFIERGGVISVCCFGVDHLSPLWAQAAFLRWAPFPSDPPAAVRCQQELCESLSDTILSAWVKTRRCRRNYLRDKWPLIQLNLRYFLSAWTVSKNSNQWRKNGRHALSRDFTPIRVTSDNTLSVYVIKQLNAWTGSYSSKVKILWRNARPCTIVMKYKNCPEITLQHFDWSLLS